MKKIAFAALLALAIALCSCGTTHNTPVPTTSASGNWEAQLVGGTGEASLLDFVTGFSVGSGGGGFNITSFSFINTNASSCFLSVASETGSATLTTSSTNQVTGSMNFSVTSGSGNVLTLTTSSTGVTGTSSNGVLTNGIASGDWSLSGGSGCTGSGTFIMCQGTASCTPPA